MPELPDVVVYLEALEARIEGRVLDGVRLGSPFVLRSVDPPLSACAGRSVIGLRRLGKRVVIALDGGLFLVIHLMVAGRLRWKKAGAKIPGKLGLAAVDFDSGTLLLTEAGSRKRASLHVAAGDRALAEHDRGGLEVLDAELPAFADAVRQEKHTLKRTLTDALTDDEIRRLFDATRDVLNEWTDRLRDEAGEAFPEKVTAFREQMAVHGRHREPCPVCESPIQRIVYSSNETNYCATCQTGGKLLADRALSRLLRKDWPRTIEELEERSK